MPQQWQYKCILNARILFCFWLIWVRMWQLRQTAPSTGRWMRDTVWVLHGDPQVLRGREGLQPLLTRPLCPEDTQSEDGSAAEKGNATWNHKHTEIFQILQLKAFMQVLQGFVIKIWSITWLRHDYDSTFVHMGNTVHTVTSLQEISSPLSLADPQFSPVLFLSSRQWNDSFEMFFPPFLQTEKQSLKVWQMLLLIRENGFACLLKFPMFASRGRKTSNNGKVWPTICI